MRKKEFNIKIYDLSGAYIRTLSPNLIMGDFSFRSTINGGQGELQLRLDLPIDSTLIAYNNIIRIYETDTLNPNGRIIYSGLVGSLTRAVDRAREYIDVRAIGISSLLTFIYYYSGSYTPSVSQDPSLTIKAIIDYFASVYTGGFISYTGSSIETTGTTANFAFNYHKCLDAIQNSANNVPWWYFLGADGVFHFHPKTFAGQTTHAFTLGKDIDSITINEKTEAIVNKYMLDYSGGSVTSQDAPSQTSYGLREFHESNGTITNSTTANAKASSEVTKNKSVTKNISIIVTDVYDIESIKPGDLVTVRNSNYPIVSLQVNAVEYGVNTARVELEFTSSLAKEVFS